MRYYIYISNAKVDMLLPQVPGALQKKVSAKLGFDIKLLSGSIETQRETLDNRIARLAVVEEYLLSNEEIAAPDSSASWIRGTVDAKFVDIGDGAILFVTENDDRIVALGGSAHHLVGASPPKRIGIPFSMVPAFTQQLIKQAEQPEEPQSAPKKTSDGRVSAGASREFVPWVGPLTWVLEHSKATAQRIEFLAKRLAGATTHKGQTITLASPLFVSSAN